MSAELLAYAVAHEVIPALFPPPQLHLSCLSEPRMRLLVELALLDDVMVRGTRQVRGENDPEFMPVPEPTSILAWCMMGGIGIGALLYRRRRKNTVAIA
ncbi:MAG: hypothetical protein WD070_10390 [Pirellulaceae bacterium]